MKCIALKRLQTELETTNNNEVVEDTEEVISSTKTTSPSLKKSPKSSDFGKYVKMSTHSHKNINIKI